MATSLRELLDGSLTATLPGISVAIARHDGFLFQGSAGVADIETSAPIRPDLLFGIGSITKTFVAVLTLKLIEERRLRLDDTTASYLGAAVDGIGNADRATIGQLLNHTSGVPSWEDDPSWIRHGRGALLEVGRSWGKADTLNYIRGQPALFAPGTQYRYANTNHTLLGLIIEQITGRDVLTEIRERILKPLGLEDVYLEGFESVPRDRLPRRYHCATSEFRRVAGIHPAFSEVRAEFIDVTDSDLSLEWTAGGMLATAPALARYGVALRDGKLLNAQSMKLMTQWIPAAEGKQVGYGLFREECADDFALVGHNGRVLGFSATLYWIENADTVVAALCNTGTIHSGEVPQGLNSVVKSKPFLQLARQLTATTSIGIP